MTSFCGKTSQKLHILQLTKGEYLLEGIQKVINRENIVNGIILGGLGTLESCTMHSVVTMTMPVENKYITWDNEPIGVSAMNGIIVNKQPHIHMTMSTYTGEPRTYTGHLENDCRVLCRMDLSILEVDDLNLTRVLDENGVEIMTEVK
ncbi:PCC domain-containing protein [Enterocloster asparagiformis]|uniref:PCC domain-containing protein n=1 Tax=Enterocloster asparagiformis TaxID=333367 RepID=UPI0004652177|nr:DUF296 domain-containing protein [Enterocloster asparagiformis]